MSQSFFFIFVPMYFVWEGRKYFFLPMLNTYYEKLIHHELNLKEKELNNDLRDLSEEVYSKAKDQMRFYSIHRGFREVKQNSLVNFFVNEEENLRRSIESRTRTLLREVEKEEAKNLREMLRGIVEAGLRRLGEIQEKPGRSILNGSFEQAIRGIKQGQMDYQGDQVLGQVMDAIGEYRKKFTKLSPEELDELVSLTEEQIANLRKLDQQGKESFIEKNKPVGIHGSLKHLKHVNETMERWN